MPISTQICDPMNSALTLYERVEVSELSPLVAPVSDAVISEVR